MTELVEAILFDVGGTLRRGTNREFSEKVILCKWILDLMGLETDPVVFTHLLDDRANAYRKWSRQELLELNETGFWTRWMLPDLAVEKVSARAVELNKIWRHADRSYMVLQDARETILGLFRAGYRLGLVSNTTSSLEAPNLLDELGLSGCFEAIVLSCQVGIRKPRPEMLLEATRRMGVEPGQCAYVGNLPDKDVASARSAGFKKTVILCDPNKPFPEPDSAETIPDHFINSLIELHDIFPVKDRKATVVPPETLYDISLSTMWGMNKFENLGDFLLAAPRLGFASVELNHRVSPSMLEGVDLKQISISSIHEPCPAVISADTLKKKDLLISSPDEERRREGVNSIHRSIDLAKELGVRAIVIHAGMVQFDAALEKKLVALFETGKSGTPEYQAVKDEMILARKERVERCINAVMKSMRELLDHAGQAGICLGLENRYHYFDLPSPDEMALFLGLADTDRLGMIYDTGHAHALASLGFYPHEDWLKRFADRIIGSHLHDSVGIQDHLAPGLGEVDFKMVAAYLPKTAFRTMEVQSHNSIEQVKKGLQKLVDAGCVHLPKGASHAHSI